MLYRNAYGVDLGQAGYQTKFKGPPVSRAEPKPDALYVAEIIGWREGKTDFAVNARVMDPEFRALRNPNWQVALWWPGAGEEGARPNKTFSSQYPVASTYSLEEMDGGIELRSEQGYVNNEGGPYVMWLDGPDIESPMWRVGWAGNHYYTGPYLVVRRKGGAPVNPPGGGTDITPPPGPGSADARSLIDSGLQLMGDGFLKVREGRAKL